MNNEVWRVTVMNPRASGREGRNWRLKVVPPATLRAAGHKPRPKSSGTQVRAEAERKAEQLARLLNAAVIQGEDPGVLEVIEKHRDWRMTDGETADSTITQYTAAIARLRDPLFGARASDLTRALVLRAVDQLQRHPYAPGTINLTVNCLRHAWTWAHEREWVSVEFPKVKRLRVKETEKRPFTDAEVDAVLAWIAEYRGGRWLPLFALLADTGARVSELLALRGHHVDFAAGTVRIGQTKTGEGRLLKPPAATMALLPRRGATELVFQAQRPGCRRSEPTHARGPLGVLWKASEALGLHEVDNHSFRRSWISSSLESGTPIHVSMRATGHKSTAVHLGYARKSVLDTGKATEAVRARRGARPWEPVDPAHRPTPPHGTVVADPKSSEIPPESRALASCWRTLRRAQPVDQAGHATPHTARSRRAQLQPAPAGVVLRWGGGHPRSERIERLVLLDPEAAMDLGDPLIAAAVRRALGVEALEGQERQA